MPRRATVANAPTGDEAPRGIVPEVPTQAVDPLDRELRRMALLHRRSVRAGAVRRPAVRLWPATR